jgi:uncharacterized OB-fold protein
MSQPMFEAPITNNQEKGWVCPKCGKVNSPTVKSCSCTKPSSVNENSQPKRNWVND